MWQYVNQRIVLLGFKLDQLQKTAEVPIEFSVAGDPIKMTLSVQKIK